MRSIVVCLLLGVFVSHLTDAVVFKFTNFVCLSYNESWIIFPYCRLKAVSRDKVALNFNATFLHPVRNIHAHLKVLKKANGFKPWVIETKLDFCRFLRSNYDPVVKVVYNLFKDFSNINHTCPLIGPQIIKGLYLRPELLKLPFPTGEYMLAMRWFLDQKLQYDTNASFLFVEDLRKT